LFVEYKPPPKYNYVKGVDVTIDNSTPKVGCPSKSRVASIGGFGEGKTKKLK
jgi:hypothetical protein